MCGEPSIRASVYHAGQGFTIPVLDEKSTVKLWEIYKHAKDCLLREDDPFSFPKICVPLYSQRKAAKRDESPPLFPWGRSEHPAPFRHLRKSLYFTVSGSYFFRLREAGNAATRAEAGFVPGVELDVRIGDRRGSPFKWNCKSTKFGKFQIWC